VNIMAEHIKQAIPSAPTADPHSAIGSDTRQQGIFLSAYYRAQAGRAPGGEQEDWLDVALSARR